MSSEIGDFDIGIDAIGGQLFAWEKTLYAQYSNSPTIIQLIDYFAQCVDANPSIDAFYNQLWNVNTAVGYGLDVWGRIVGVNRVLEITPSKFFGFEEAGNISADPYNQSPFYAGGALVSSYSLSDDAFRFLIIAKAAANIWDGSIPGLNAILRILFPGQVCYVTDGLDMTMTYTFSFILTPVQVSIAQTSGVLPRPCGVSATVVQI